MAWSESRIAGSALGGFPETNWTTSMPDLVALPRPDASSSFSSASPHLSCFSCSLLFGRHLLRPCLQPGAASFTSVLRSLFSDHFVCAESDSIFSPDAFS